MEFSPSEVFIPHSKETLLQPLPLVAYVVVCAADLDLVVVVVFGAGVEWRMVSERE